MKRIDLISIKHNYKIGDKCPYIEPNIIDDCIFFDNEVPIGFYINKMPDKMCKIADLANAEFKSNNVPKTVLNRMDGIIQGYKKNGKRGESSVKQMSAIIGSIPPKPAFKRSYCQISSVHTVKSARNFIKSMLMLAIESEKLIKEILPIQYEIQNKIFKSVPSKWKFGNLFTSSISNYNISAPFHIDTGNIIGAVNVIICKKNNSNGGDLHIPDYNATIGQKDNSILVYPAWKNMHGVTPIIPTHEGGYRNSLIFYPLKAFIEEGSIT
jgi:hypothetical protein